MATKIFVNLPVKDLKVAMDFYSAIGFVNNPQFTNEQAASMAISDDIYLMILIHPFFQTFTEKRIIDAKTEVQVLNSLSKDSREEVDALVKKAADAGGKPYAQAVDHGFMYQSGFEDPDGNTWEVFYMDMNAVPTHMDSVAG